MAGLVEVDKRPIEKPGYLIPVSSKISLKRSDSPYASRGGLKLEAALDRFHVEVKDKVFLDVGASTGGFTDCLLKHGARKVISVDVGYGQLAWKLRQDPRVVVMERANIRHLTPEQLPERPAFFTADCSFISLRLVLPPLRALLAERCAGVVLIKPQFEAGRDEVGKGGVVRNPEIRDRVVQEVLNAARALGFEHTAVIPSPLLGPKGNTEYMGYLRTP